MNKETIKKVMRYLGKVAIFDHFRHQYLSNDWTDFGVWYKYLGDSHSSRVDMSPKLINSVVLNISENNPFILFYSLMKFHEQIYQLKWLFRHCPFSSSSTVNWRIVINCVNSTIFENNVFEHFVLKRYLSDERTGLDGSCSNWLVLRVFELIWF